MEYSLRFQPVSSVLEIGLSEGESVVAQPNSMLAMTSGIRLAARIGRRNENPTQSRTPIDSTSESPSTSAPFAPANSSPMSTSPMSTSPMSTWYSGFKNLLGGESFFVAEFTAIRDDQKLTLAPDVFGDILELPLGDARSYYLTQGSYLANIGDCNLQIRYGGIKGILSRKGFFLLNVSGHGTVFCQAYGAIMTKTLEPGEHFVVDNRFVIAFSDTVTYQFVKAAKSLKDSLMSGEGFVNRYTGPGRLFYQARSKPSSGYLSRILDAAF